MRGLSEQHDLRIADAIQERTEGRLLDVVDPFGRFPDQAADGRDGGGAGSVRVPAFRPALRADERNELHRAQIVPRVLRLAHPLHPNEALRARRVAYRDDEPPAHLKLLEERLGHGGSPRCHDDGRVGPMLRPPERPVAV